MCLDTTLWPVVCIANIPLWMDVFLHIVFSFLVTGTEHRVSHTQGKHCTLSYIIPALFVFLVVSYNKCKLVVSMAC